MDGPCECHATTVRKLRQLKVGMGRASKKAQTQKARTMNRGEAAGGAGGAESRLNPVGP